MAKGKGNGLAALLLRFGKKPKGDAGDSAATSAGPTMPPMPKLKKPPLRVAIAIGTPKGSGKKMMTMPKLMAGAGKGK